MTTDPSVDFVTVFNDTNLTVTTTTNGTMPAADPYGQPEEVSRVTLWVLAVLMPVVMLVILIGNTLVVVAVLKVRVLQTIQNYYLVSLAASDLMVGGLIMPLALVNELMGYWSLGRIMCDVHVTLDIFACTASILNLCAIGLDRHFAITQAVKYTATKTTKHAIGGIAMVWTASTVICLPPLLGWGTDSFQPGLYPRCDYTDKFSYVLYSTVGSFFGPLPIMLVVYTRIFIAARSRIRNLRKRSGRHSATTMSTNVHRLEVPPGVDGREAQARRKEGRGKDRMKAGISSYPITETTNQETPPATPGVQLRPENLTAVYSKHALNSGKPVDNNKNGTSSHHAPQALHSKAIQPSPPNISSGTLTDVTATRSPLPKQDPVLQDAKERRWKMMQGKERRLTVVICIVTGAFVTCWSPFFVAYVVRTVHRSLVSSALFRGFVWLGYCNSALNPIIYTLMNTDFRQAFQQVLIRKFNTQFRGNRH
ncbi:PREDICTED: 5-hydroxytryptamine receptor 1B-like [Branchiostoma belcheri]|uniref:5-hydroxytryptamine receptor 1B-like n=1 Tax=Branchiostoma belcheri TaxID=7741 RepID=A0A6P4XYR7_BRABE|nr:PREDICTED: 5-hydroxytryptamine receptor 1B-like [Branchiostoma belcheri]